jgi:hypothetical protein
MALSSFDLGSAVRLSERDLPEPARAWIENRRERTRALQSAGVVPGALVQSDPATVWQALDDLIAAAALEGDVFLEWGSGIGVATGLAAIRGLPGFGIEIAAGFAAEAATAATAAGIQARFAEGSFVSGAIAGCFAVRGTYGATMWTATPDRDAYAALELQPSQADLVFAFPWPREHDIFEALFDAVARPGAVLCLARADTMPRYLRKR